MSVTPISYRKLEAISEWMLANKLPLTRENWIDINWFVEGEDFCAIPRYLSNEDENGDPISSGRKAKIIHLSQSHLIRFMST